VDDGRNPFLVWIRSGWQELVIQQLEAVSDTKVTLGVFKGLLLAVFLTDDGELRPAHFCRETSRMPLQWRRVDSQAGHRVRVFKVELHGHAYRLRTFPARVAGEWP